jgi:hypothetical protein
MLQTPTTEFVFEALVSIGPPLSLGETAQVLRRAIPITGGRFKGPLIEGEVVPGGADWQTVRPRRLHGHRGDLRHQGRRRCGDRGAQQGFALPGRRPRPQCHDTG